MAQFFKSVLFMAVVCVSLWGCGTPPGTNNNQINNQNNNNNQPKELGKLSVSIKTPVRGVETYKICVFSMEYIRGDKGIYWGNVGTKYIPSICTTTTSTQPAVFEVQPGEYAIFDDNTDKYMSWLSRGVDPEIGDEPAKPPYLPLVATVAKDEVTKVEMDLKTVIMTNGDLPPDGSWWCRYYYEWNPGQFGYTEGAEVLTYGYTKNGKNDLVVSFEGDGYGHGVGPGNILYSLYNGVIIDGSFDKTGDTRWGFVYTKTDASSTVRREFHCGPIKVMCKTFGKSELPDGCLKQ